MNLRQYQLDAKRTCPDLEGNGANFLHMEMGIYTELAGELLNCYKRHLAYGKELDMVNVAEEIADTMWYVVNEATFNENEFDPDYKPVMVLHPDANIIIAITEFIKMRSNGMFMRYTQIVDYLYSIAQLAGIDFYQALTNNINKLKVRYPEKFDTEKALNRDLAAELKVL